MTRENVTWEKELGSCGSTGALTSGHEVSSARVLLYSRSGSEFDFDTAEWVVLVNFVWLE